MADERLPKRAETILQKTRKTTAKIGGLSEDRHKEGRGERKVERKRQQPEAMEIISKICRTGHGVANDQPHTPTKVKRE